MMHKRYTSKEKKEIVKEALKSKNKFQVAVKYQIHLSTLYNWISLSSNENNRDCYIGFKITEQEYKKLQTKVKAMGYENDMSSYIRKILFSEYITNGSSADIVSELYKTRGELNKIGNNINQIANYANHMGKQNYVTNDVFDNFQNEAKPLFETFRALKNNIDDTLTKIY